MIVACIGKRDLLVKEFELCKSIGMYLAKTCNEINSGNADGADNAFASGANLIDPRRVNLYLPWPKYNLKYIHADNNVIKKPEKFWDVEASKYHEAWHLCNNAAIAMHARNFGLTYKSDMVLAFLNYNRPGYGGTGLGWRVAVRNNIPHLDLNNKSLEEVIDFINKNKV